MNYEVNNIRRIRNLDENRVLYMVEAKIFDKQELIFKKDLEVRVNINTRSVFIDTNYLGLVIQDNNIRRTLVYHIRRTVEESINIERP